MNYFQPLSRNLDLRQSILKQYENIKSHLTNRMQRQLIYIRHLNDHQSKLLIMWDLVHFAKSSMKEGKIFYPCDEYLISAVS